jgi:hypothetical protein
VATDSALHRIRSAGLCNSGRVYTIDLWFSDPWSHGDVPDRELLAENITSSPIF